MPSTEPSPRPWRLEPNARRIFVDANWRYVGSCFVGEASALVVDAVNERDRLAADEARYRTDNVRLRDLVRRLSRHLANYITSESENDLLREARAAIGEGQP